MVSGATPEEATEADEGSAGRTHVHASLQYPWAHQTPTSHCSPASMRALPQTGGAMEDESAEDTEEAGATALLREEEAGYSQRQPTTQKPLPLQGTSISHSSPASRILFPQTDGEADA